MQLFRTDKKLTPSWNLVQPSVQLIRENVWAVFYLAFLPNLLLTVAFVLLGAGQSSGQMQHFVFDGRHITGLILLAAGAVASLLAYPGYIILQLRAIRGEHPDAMECFRQGLPQLLHFIIMSVLGGIIIMLGLIALIIPGLMLFRGFYLAPYFLIDKKLKPAEALRRSYDASKPHAGYLWGTIGVSAVFGMTGSIFGRIPVVGYLISLAIGLVYAFAPALRYGETAKDIPVRAVASKV